MEVFTIFLVVLSTQTKELASRLTLVVKKIIRERKMMSVTNEGFNGLVEPPPSSEGIRQQPCQSVQVVLGPNGPDHEIQDVDREQKLGSFDESFIWKEVPDHLFPLGGGGDD